MKTIKIIFALFTIFFISPISLNAQTSESDNPKISADKQTLVWTRFDEKKNETIVSTYSLIVYSKPYDASSYDEKRIFCFHETLLLTAGFFYNGKTLTDAPDKIEFVIKSNMIRHANFKKQKNRILSVWADKNELKLGEMKLISSSMKDSITTVRGSGLKNNAKIIDCPHIEEELAIHIPTETFKEIADSKTVKIKIGDFDVKLRKSDIEVFQNLVRRLSGQ